MSATSEALSLESWFAIGTQSAKGTAATTLYKTLATVSNLAPIYEFRDDRSEHPAANSVWVRSANQTVTGSLAGARVTFALRPKFIVPVLHAFGYQSTATDNTTYYSHAVTQGTNANHKWMTVAWNVADSDGAFVTRGVDMRGTSLSIEASTEEIICTAEFRGLTVEPMSGSPTYVDEQADEIVPWEGARTTLTAGVSGSTYPIVERVRGVTINITNTLREDDKALWEPTRTTLGRESHDVSYSFTGINMSDSMYEAAFYGADAGTATTLSPIVGDINLSWESTDNISGAATPYKFEIDTPNVQWQFDANSAEANGTDIITIDGTANVIGTGTPVTISVDNNVASY